jgi:hypothetical protein
MFGGGLVVSREQLPAAAASKLLPRQAPELLSAARWRGRGWSATVVRILRRCSDECSGGRGWRRKRASGHGPAARVDRRMCAGGWGRMPPGVRGVFFSELVFMLFSTESGPI